MSNSLIVQITSLTDEWYSLVSRDHHKDRDCHWYINMVWSYGHPPYYRIEHYGYIHEDVNEKFDTKEAALNRLHEILVKAVEEEKKVVHE